jgi:hypothetical protein
MGYLVFLPHDFEERVMNLDDTAARMQLQLDNLGFNSEIATFNQFVQWLEITINRRIHLLQMKMPPGVYGAWISDAERSNEYVFYNASLPALLQTHIQIHELCHLICEHPTLQVTSKTLGAMLQAAQNGSIPSFFTQSTLVCALPASGSYREIEAETMALLIQTRFNVISS